MSSNRDHCSRCYFELCITRWREATTTVSTHMISCVLNSMVIPRKRDLRAQFIWKYRPLIIFTPPTSNWRNRHHLQIYLGLDNISVISLSRKIYIFVVIMTSKAGAPFRVSGDLRYVDIHMTSLHSHLNDKYCPSNLGIQFSLVCYKHDMIFIYIYIYMCVCVCDGNNNILDAIDSIEKNLNHIYMYIFNSRFCRCC